MLCSIGILISIANAKQVNISTLTSFCLQNRNNNKTPAKAFTPPAETKMGTRPGRAVTRAFIGGVVFTLISVLPN